MKAQITKVLLDTLKFTPVVHSGEYPTLDSAYEVMKRYIPTQPQYVPVDFTVKIYWEDGDYLTCDMKLTYAMEERHAHPRHAIFNRMGFFAGICQPQNMTAEQYQVNMSLNALDGDVNALNQECIKWMMSHDMGYGDDYGREITAEELADLPSTWENSTVDQSRYYDSVLVAWEVRDWMYEHYKTVGGLCQQVNGKYYIA